MSDPFAFFLTVIVGAVALGVVVFVLCLIYVMLRAVRRG